ncbi:MAG: cyclase family protein [Anaerolineales bacterium]
MRIYDITLTISPELPVWPGDQLPELVRTSKIEEGDEANVSRMCISVHTGTHVDSPYHFHSEGLTVEDLNINHLIGRAYVLHLPDVDLITAEILDNAEIPTRSKRVLFKTKNSTFWSLGEKNFQTDYVAISDDGAEYLVNRGIKLVGVDYLSVAPYEQTVRTHEIFLKAGVIILEGVNLSEVSQGRYTLYCLPLKLAGLDGSPARVILVGV